MCVNHNKQNLPVFFKGRIVLGAECDNMNFDIGLEEMLQPITKETSSRQNGVKNETI
jgi:hypothetical protein